MFASLVPHFQRWNGFVYLPRKLLASNKVIARRLGISTHTAKFHVASLLDKLLGAPTPSPTRRGVVSYRIAGKTSLLQIRVAEHPLYGKGVHSVLELPFHRTIQRPSRW